MAVAQQINGGISAKNGDRQSSLTFRSALPFMFCGGSYMDSSSL
jgi:hypothetical protein